jgi:predicted SnoaL-like aldol condensation-catalyzing enzyme
MRSWPRGCCTCTVTGGRAHRKRPSPPRAKFPDLHYTVSNLIAEGDLVAWVWESKATNPETGKRQTQAGTTMHRVRDGKMVERWMFARPSVVEEA